ncbi:MAG: hypothetical protein B6I34_07300 [Anaerolineaceae bacterium 4572_32.1]|nr:MAG: hypothetical protein B6I34_07300 [Anaerolineaceae bacterium 4572_32.1]
MYYPPETRVSSLTTIRRERMLPVAGEVLVQPNQRVEPWDVVAQAAVPGGYHIVEIAQALKITEKEVPQCLLKHEGEDVKAGEPIAVRRGLFRRALRSPADGFLAAVGGGRALIEADTRVVELIAGMRGRVTEVRRNRGCIIETIGAIVQGIWGNNQEGHGVLKALSDSPHNTLTREDIKVGSQGAVILAGQALTLRALEFAQEMQVRGIIVGSLSIELLPAARAATFPIVVTEGWGAISMSPIIFDVLKSNDGREVALSAWLKTGWEQRRPEVIIPRVANEPPAEELAFDLVLEKGATVRVLRPPHTGATGTVLDFPALPRKLETGMTLRGAEIELISGQRIFVPLANLEWIH